MKQLFLGTAFFASLLFATSCGNSKAESAVEDSAREADSIFAVQQAAEQARIDSIRQDSIRTAEEKAEFLSHIPSPKKLMWAEPNQQVSYLKSLGFSGNKPRIDVDNNGYYKTSFNYISGDKSCKVICDGDYNSCEIKTTITGDEEALEQYYNDAKKLRNSGSEGGTEVSRNGNTVTVSSYGA